MPRITNLPTTAFPTLEHEIAASIEGETVSVTLRQFRDVLNLSASAIAFRSTSVNDALANLIDNPIVGEVSDYAKQLLTNPDATTMRRQLGVGDGSGSVSQIGPMEANHLAIFSDSTGNAIKSGGVAGNAANRNVGTTEGTVADGFLTAPKSSPIFTGNPQAPTQVLGNRSKRLATTEFVAAALDAIQTPMFKPVTMTTPAADATGIGAGGTYTFVVQAFAGDTVGFYPDYPVPLASRFVNVFEVGGNAPVKVFPVSGSGAAFPVSFTGSGLANSKVYEFQAGYTDAEGNSVLSQRVKATTAAQFKPGIGQSHEGGFLAFEQFGDGRLFDLVVAPKSTEASRTWQSNNSNARKYSRVNGFVNSANANANLPAHLYATGISIGGVPGYLGAIDELRAISSELRPSVAPAGSPFGAGGSEVFDGVGDGVRWSSTEFDASSAIGVRMALGSEYTNGKTFSTPFRPIRRIEVAPPSPYGTFVAAQGGWLWFYFTDLSSGTPITYAVFKADKAVEVTRAWDSDSNGGVTNRISRTNGIDFTNAAGSTARWAAAVYCQSLVHNNKDDWYLGGVDEYLSGAKTNSLLPEAQQIGRDTLWTATEASEASALSAKQVQFSSATSFGESNYAKVSGYLVVPIRRVPLSQLTT